jgi:hypothetical protein
MTTKDFSKRSMQQVCRCMVPSCGIALFAIDLGYHLVSDLQGTAIHSGSVNDKTSNGRNGVGDRDMR